MRNFTWKSVAVILIILPTTLRAQLIDESFETWPTDWVIMTGANGAGGSWTWDQFWDPNDAPDGEEVARLTTEPSDANGIPEDWLITPQLRPLPGNNVLTFWQSNWTASVDVSKLHVKISTTTQTDQSAYTTLATYTENDITDVYVKSSIDLSAYNNTPIYIAFVVESDWGDDWYIDLVEGVYRFVPDPDAAITAINGPSSDCGLSSSNTITVEVSNTGIETLTSIPIEYNLNNGGWVSAGTYSGTLTTGNSDTYTFDLDFSLIKDYELAVRTQYPGDEKPANDSLGLYTISHLEPTDLFDSGTITNDLESGTSQNGWNTVDANGDGTGIAGEWSLKTDGNGCSGDNYLCYTKSGNTANDWLFTPCLDFVAGETYRITVKYRTNGTTGWFGNGFQEKMLLTVGTSQDPNDNPTVLNDVGTFVTSSCQTATGDYLVSSSGTYYFGIKCYSAANNGELRIDDISISIVPPSETTDATATDVMVPNYDCGLGTSEDVVVTIENEGANNITTCAIEYNLNGAGWLSAGSYNGNISYGQTDTYTFNMNLSAAAGQTLNVRTRLTGDGVPANDALTGYVIPDFQSHDVGSTDFEMGFEAGDDFSNWRIYDNNNDADGDFGTWAFKTGLYGCSGSGYAQYSYSRDNDADDWLFTPCLFMEAGESYNITFDYNAQYPFLGTYMEKMKVAIGTTATPAGMSTTLNDYGTFAKIPILSICYPGDINFTVPSDGVYYIGWQAYSDADQYYVILDNINITKTTPDLYYSVLPGDASDAIWAPTRNGTPRAITFKSTTSLVIQDNRDVNVDVDIEADNITIETGANLMTDNGRTIDLEGDWTNDGYFDYIKSTVVMSGSANQEIIGATNFNNLTADNAGGVDMTTGIDTIIGTLTVEQGILNTHDNLVIRSDISGTARVATISSGDIIGNAVVERYIPAGETNYRMLCSAVEDATIDDWKADFLTSGFQGSHWPDWPTAANPFYSIQYYNESASGNVKQGFEHPNSASDAIVPGLGYWVWCGDRLSGTQEFTIDVVGPLNTGDVNANLEFTNTGDADADGWNLVGNPYASPLDWSDLIDLADLSKIFYVYDPQSGNMDLWNDQDGSFLYFLNGNIESGQAFWVQAKSATSLIIEEADKVGAAIGLFENELEQEKPATLTIDINSDINSFSDRVKLSWNNQATYGLDDYDAKKTPFGNYYAPKMSMNINGDLLSISASPAPKSEVNIPLHLSVTKTGTYTLTFNPDAEFSKLTCFEIFDTETNAATTLFPGLTMDIELTKGVASERYVLRTTGTLTKETSNITCFGAKDGSASILAPTPDNWEIQWQDLDGNVLKIENVSGTESTISNLNAGEYIAVLTHASCGVKQTKVVIEEPASLNNSANVSNETCFGARNGQVDVSIFGGVAPYTVNFNGSVSNETTFKNLGPGNYSVFVTDANRCKSTVNKVTVEEGNAFYFAINQSETAVIAEENTPVQFTYAGQTPDKIVWEFGDGGYATALNPTHTFTEEGTYQIDVTVEKDGCSFSHTPIFVEASSSPTSVTDIMDEDNDGTIFYRNHALKLSLNKATTNLNYKVLDINGKEIADGQIRQFANNNSATILLPNISSGSYILTVQNNELNNNWKFVVTE